MSSKIRFQGSTLQLYEWTRKHVFPLILEGTLSGDNEIRYHILSNMPKGCKQKAVKTVLNETMPKGVIRKECLPKGFTSSIPGHRANFSKRIDEIVIRPAILESLDELKALPGSRRHTKAPRISESIRRNDDYDDDAELEYLRRLIFDDLESTGNFQEGLVLQLPPKEAKDTFDIYGPEEEEEEDDMYYEEQGMRDSESVVEEPNPNFNWLMDGGNNPHGFTAEEFLRDELRGSDSGDHFDFTVHESILRHIDKDALEELMAVPKSAMTGAAKAYLKDVKRISEEGHMKKNWHPSKKQKKLLQTMEKQYKKIAAKQTTNAKKSDVVGDRQRARAEKLFGVGQSASQELAISMVMESVDSWKDLKAEKELCVPRPMPSLEDQSFLIGDTALSTGVDKTHLIANAPLLSEDALLHANENNAAKVPQYSLLGTTRVSGSSKRLFTNVNVPLSAFVCGLQGSGKSHTLSCLLENFMVPEPKLGCLQKPLPGLVFQFSPHTHSSYRPCEAGFLGKPPDPSDPLPTTVKSVRSVNILVSSSNYASMKEAYANIPNASVSALRFRPKDLTIGSMLQLMAVGSTSGSDTPLYMHRVTQILRDMATMNAGMFDYEDFKKELTKANFQSGQSTMLRMRLDLLESFLGDDETHSQFSVDPGVLTLVDLSCPFVDPETACALFSICLDFYLSASSRNARDNRNRGLVVALDEAHKYLTSTTAATKFTESLLSLIRQQRHYGARVIVSTQEPTVSPRLLDLCSMTVCHRFTSPEWFRMLSKHVNVADEGREKIFNRILDLNVGQALVFAPTAVIRPPSAEGTEGEDEEGVFVERESEEKVVIRKGFIDVKKKGGMKDERGILELKVRRRITFDGGKSIISMEPGFMKDVEAAEAEYGSTPGAAEEPKSTQEPEEGESQELEQNEGEEEGKIAAEA